MNVAYLISLDWLEVYCLEPFSLSPEFFKRKGFVVELRDYGTPQYSQMFTLKIGKVPFVEIRRQPYSLKSQGGIFPDGACHIKLCNAMLYNHDSLRIFDKFLKKYHLKVQSVSRVDIAVDFAHMIDYKNPQDFVSDFLRNQIHLRGRYETRMFGVTSYGRRLVNSLSWGAHRTMVGMKMYNKTLEIEQCRHKEYIRQFWIANNLISPKKEEQPDVWRIEFSIKTSCKFFIKKKAEQRGKLALEGPDQSWLYCDKKWNLGHVVNIIRGSNSIYLKNTLSVWLDRASIEGLAKSCLYTYFRFARFDGNSKKKFPKWSRCPQVRTFDLDCEIYIPKRNDCLSTVPVQLPKFLRSVKALANQDGLDINVRMSADIVYQYMNEKYSGSEWLDLRVAERKISSCLEQEIPFVVDSIIEQQKINQADKAIAGFSVGTVVPTPPRQKLSTNIGAPF